jgi:SAM-dependent methyltransferase
MFTAPAFDDSSETFRIARCTKCALVRTEPLLEGDALAAYYNRGYYGTYEAKFGGPLEALLEHLAARRAQSLLRRIELHRTTATSDPARVLDVGCGRGAFLRSLRKLGCECHGTELPGFPFPEDTGGIHFAHGELTEIAYEAASFDAVHIWHVLEHTTQPAATVGEIARILRPGGVLALAVPNFSSTQRRWFTRGWFHLDLPRHTHHFSKRVLLNLLRRHGLQAVKVSTSSLEQNIYGFVQSLQNRLLPSAGPNALYTQLKSGKDQPRRAAFLPMAALAGLTLPLAAAEHLASTATGQGATLIVYAVKR